jgi:hypothetical protein
MRVSNHFRNGPQRCANSEQQGYSKLSLCIQSNKGAIYVPAVEKHAGCEHIANPWFVLIQMDMA